MPLRNYTLTPHWTYQASHHLRDWYVLEILHNVLLLLSVSVWRTALWTLQDWTGPSECVVLCSCQSPVTGVGHLASVCRQTSQSWCEPCWQSDWHHWNIDDKWCSSAAVSLHGPDTATDEMNIIYNCRRHSDWELATSSGRLRAGDVVTRLSWRRRRGDWELATCCWFVMSLFDRNGNKWELLSRLKHWVYVVDDIVMYWTQWTTKATFFILNECTWSSLMSCQSASEWKRPQLTMPDHTSNQTFLMVGQSWLWLT